jgi:hypothetical protein
VFQLRDLNALSSTIPKWRQCENVGFPASSAKLHLLAIILHSVTIAQDSGDRAMEYLSFDTNKLPNHVNPDTEISQMLSTNFIRITFMWAETYKQ